MSPTDLQAGIEAENTLNGAQIRAALDVIDRLAGGDDGTVKIAPLVAIELLAAVGIARDVAERMVTNSRKTE